jgi:SnoaL-like domain
MKTQDTGDRFLEALLNRDFDAMGAHLHPRVRLRALQPGGAIVRVGANPVVARWAEWFGGWDRLTVVDYAVSPVASRLRMAYHFDVTADTDRREVAHQLLVDVTDERIAAIDLLCSGFIETARPDRGA